MKNCTVSVFEKPFEAGMDELFEKLSMAAAKPIGKTEKERWGFVGINGVEMAEPIAGGYMLAIQKQERVLPSWAVNDALAEKVAEWEQESGKKASASFKKGVKDAVIYTMLPQCFVRKTVYYVWLGKDRLLIDSKSPAVCDAITSLLREALGSLPCINVAPRSVPGAVMAGWLRDSVMFPNGIGLNGFFSIRAKEKDDGEIKIKEASLYRSSVDDALDCCPMVSEIALSHNDTIGFTLNEKLQLSKIKLDDITIDSLIDRYEGDKSAEQRAMWLTEVTAINAALDDIFAAMNGLEGVDE